MADRASAPNDPTVVLVGAGPAALAVALTADCHDLADRLEAIDPSGRWLAAWDRRFAAQAIPHLRSPAVHHPHPDPFALLAQCEPEELVTSGNTRLPTSAGFRRFVDAQVEAADLDGRVHAGKLRALSLDPDGRARLVLDDGSQRCPDHVVLAANARHAVLPAVLEHLRDHPRVAVGEAARLADTPVGGRIAVLGGGLSAAHLAVGAAERGAEVHLLTRRRLTVRRFDTHPSWLGPSKRRPFEREPDPFLRRRAIDRARGGGTIPHRMRQRLQTHVDRGAIVLHERTTILAADADSRGVCVDLRGSGRLETDVLWTATGGAIDVARDDLCRTLQGRFPTTIAGGLPELTTDLRWPGTNVHLVGGVAGLRLGPTAGNLIGHRRAAQRLVAAWRALDPVRADRIATGAGACPHRYRPARVTQRVIATPG
jgi:hypothetical protein